MSDHFLNLYSHDFARVAVGAGDYYLIANNRVHGATAGVSDGGSGTNKSVSGNV